MQDGAEPQQWKLASNKDETTLTYAKSEKKDADASDSKSDTGKDTGSTAKGNLDVSEIASEALPSIVSITTKSVQEVQNYFGMYGMYGYAPQQAGTGSRGQWFRYYCW
ncbi:MAG: hypothetical protein ACLRVO_21130 [Blautia wexlerae]